mgnify:CR=1 FL=1
MAFRPTENFRTRVSEALYLTAPRTGASVDYAKGVVVGVIACLIGLGMPPEKALKLIAELLPNNYRKEAIPRPFRETLELYLR